MNVNFFFKEMIWNWNMTENLSETHVKNCITFHLLQVIIGSQFLPNTKYVRDWP